MIDLRNYFDRVLVINLPSRVDRIDAFQRRAADAGITGITRFKAIDGGKAGKPEWFRANEGAWGCLLSHHRIAVDAMQDDLKSYLVFEDDAIFRPGFAETLVSALDRLDGVAWDQLYLGGMHVGGEPTPFREGIVRSNRIGRTHAYAVQASFMPALAKNMLEARRYTKPGNPVHFDHALGGLHGAWGRTILGIDPWICGQAAGYSDILGVPLKECFWDNVRGAKSLRELQAGKTLAITA